MRYFLLLLILSFSLSCKEQKNQTVSSDQDIENFDTFFKTFAKDSIFQSQRIIFPFKMTYWESELETPSIEYYDTTNYRFLNFDYKPSYSKREIDAYTQEIKFYQDTARVEIRGVDNGIYIDTDFIIVKGLWYCSHFTDSST
jgi:hypothetical protein